MITLFLQLALIVLISISASADQSLVKVSISNPLISEFPDHSARRVVEVIRITGLNIKSESLDQFFTSLSNKNNDSIRIDAKGSVKLVKSAELSSLLFNEISLRQNSGESELNIEFFNGGIRPVCIHELADNTLLLACTKIIKKNAFVIRPVVLKDELKGSAIASHNVKAIESQVQKVNIVRAAYRVKGEKNSVLSSAKVGTKLDALASKEFDSGISTTPFSDSESRADQKVEGSSRPQNYSVEVKKNRLAKGLKEMTALNFAVRQGEHFLELPFSNRAEYSLMRISQDCYRLTISKGVILEKELQLPYFAPMDFQGISAVKAEQRNGALVVDVHMERNHRLKASRDGSVIMLKAI